MVLGRALQGAGGGGLVPVTLALVADLWPPRRRGVPLGVVGAVQEFGSVVGPLYGAALTAASTWRAIFYVNMPLAALIAAGVRVAAPADVAWRRARRVTSSAGALAVLLRRRDRAGRRGAAGAHRQRRPWARCSRRCSTASAPPRRSRWWRSSLLWRSWLRELLVPARTSARWCRCADCRADCGRVDWLGGALVALVLGCIVVAFASADPQRGVVGDAAPVLLPAAAVLGALFVVRELRTAEPLVDLRALRDRAAVGSLLTNLAVGAALMAALVDIPVFARATVDPTRRLPPRWCSPACSSRCPLGAVLGGLARGARSGTALVAGDGHAAQRCDVRC